VCVCVCVCVYRAVERIFGINMKGITAIANIKITLVSKKKQKYRERRSMKCRLPMISDQNNTTTHNRYRYVLLVWYMCV